MTLASDLLEQASHLATREPRRPKQASLRRSISAAYYSLFHLITAEGAARIVASEQLRPAVARAFEHRELFKVASALVRINAGDTNHWLGRHVTAPVEPELVRVCAAFADLQGQRHSADYDGYRSFTRTEVSNAISLVDGAHADWEATRGTEHALVFMLASARLLRDR